MKAAKAVIFLMILIMVLIGVNNIIMYKQPNGIPQYKSFYEQEEDSVDVLFVGTSHVYCDIDPAYVYDECGILSYDLATGGAPLAATYYSMKQALAYQHPNVIAVELYSLKGSIPSQREIVDATYGIRDPRIKYASLREIIGDNSLLEFYMAFPWYHSLYNDVSRSDFSGYDYIQNSVTKTYLYFPQKLQSYKGASIFSCTTSGTALDISEIESESQIGENAERYLNQMIRLCAENNIELCFIVSPFMSRAEYFCEQVNYVRSNIAEPNGINLIDGGRCIEEIGIDWSTDAAEGSHLNYKGAEKYSRWLARQMADLYGLQDCHGMPAAESWEQNLEWENEVYLAFRLLEAYQIEDYIHSWNNMDADVFVSFCGNEWDAYKERFFPLIELNEEGKTVDGLARINGVWNFHYCNDTELIIEEGIDTLAVRSSEQGSLINYNGSDCVKARNGINVVVYDRYLEDMVDCVAFINENINTSGDLGDFSVFR